MRRPPLLLALLASILLSAPGVDAAEADPAPVRPMVFPVIGEVSLTDTYGAPRSGGRRHQGQDLLGRKMQELVATADGEITYLTSANGLGGAMLELTDAEGWTTTYVHLNNDTPGTDDGRARPEDTFGPGIAMGARVVAGQLLGYMGDSGNAEEAGAQLHFELAGPDGNAVNPIASLRAARRLSSPEGAVTGPSPLRRLAGPDRVATALAVSAAGWPDRADTVVLAAGDRYAEALPASVLAAKVGGPLLLSVGPALTPRLASELDRLRTSRVIVVGSVPVAVSDAVAAGGRSVSRLGPVGDAVGTAVAVAGAVGGGGGTVVLVSEDRFADGVSATALAAGRGWPVLLSGSTTVPQRSVDAWRSLGVRRVVVVGGTAVVGKNITDFLASAGRCAGGAGCEVERLAGSDRYATSVAVVERSIALGGRSAAEVFVGTGTAYADVLASGPLAAARSGLALLVDGTGQGNDAASRTFLRGNAAAVEQVAILGGTSAVSAAAERAVQQALGRG